MNAAGERYLASMRRLLANARELELCGITTVADAQGRAAARELEKAIAEDERVERQPGIAA